MDQWGCRIRPTKVSSGSLSFLELELSGAQGRPPTHITYFFHKDWSGKYSGKYDSVVFMSVKMIVSGHPPPSLGLGPARPDVRLEAEFPAC